MASIVCQPVVLPKRTNSLGYAGLLCLSRSPAVMMSHRTFAVPSETTSATDGEQRPPAQFSFVLEGAKSIKRTKRPKGTKPHPSQSRRASPTTSPWRDSPPPFFPLIPLSKQCGDMLTYYQLQFSPTVMLTFHVHVNPWQMSLPMSFDVPCLMDGIVALSRRHHAHICQQAEDVEVLVLKDRALRTFRFSLHTVGTAALLATVLTLVALEYARTSSAHWAVHIAGAHRTCWRQTDRIRSDMVFFRTAADGGVFSVGSINWCCSVGWNDYDNSAGRVTLNVVKGFLNGR
ncbi:hypothetical protein SEUCBS139899_000044 [Sporothrix eucalyptigena]|uniref:Uncharacterized protein n=1 Tax=Sporothrix eucalyptigena TaxID=1812306 RepID=A0ABP0AR72_9PEZI